MLLSLLWACSTASEPPQPPSVVVYVVDSLRADHGPCTSGCDDALVFERGRAQTSWTRPSVATILTGLRPGKHGANAPGKGLEPDLTTLAELFAASGYQTHAVVTNDIIPASMGFDQGFDQYVHLRQDGDRRQIYPTVGEAHAAVDAWLASREKGPFFLYVHTSDPHFPYTPGDSQKPSDDEVGGTAFMSKLREGELDDPQQYRDELMRRYGLEAHSALQGFHELRQRLPANTVVLFTSDHGQEFYEHGDWEHGSTLHGEVLDVPFVLWGAGHSGSRGLARHVDIVPTLAAVAGIPLPHPVDGIDLLRAEPSHATGHLRLSDDDETSIEDARHKLMLDHKQGSELLFDRAADPGEQSPVVDQPVRDRLHAQMAKDTELVRPTRRDEHDPELLRELGYLGAETK